MALGSGSSSAILFCSGIACCLGAVCDRTRCRCLRNSGSVRSAKGLGEGGPEYLRLRPSGGAKFAGQGLPVEWTSSGTVEVAAGVENEKQKQHCHKRCELAVVCQWPVAIQSQSQLRTGNPSQWNQSVPGQINPTLFSKSRTDSHSNASSTISPCGHESTLFPGGNKGAVRIPLYSFQYPRRPGCTAKLLCFHIISGFESHRLHQLRFLFSTTYIKFQGSLSHFRGQHHAHHLAVHFACVLKLCR